MEIHHTKHHQAYITNLNKAIEGTALEGKTILEILAGLDMTNMAVRNNGGGHYNHSLFWEVLNPNDRGYLTGPLRDAIKPLMVPKENFEKEFAQAAMTRFGSGWAWLCATRGVKLKFAQHPIRIIH